jgi:signal transduction histidine kinase
MPVAQSDLLSAFGAALLLIDRSRRIAESAGATARLLGMEPDSLLHIPWNELIQQYAMPEAAEALYWAIEAAFEGYIGPQFLPTSLPFCPEKLVHLAAVDDEHIALRLEPDPRRKLDALLYKDLRPSLTSAVGFTNVILKGIDGPLTDLQLEDLSVIATDGQFALNLVEDLWRQWIAPRLVGPVPISARRLLQLTEDDLPQRHFANQGLTLNYDLVPDVAVYSNGAIRTALIDLIKLLPQYVAKQSQITIYGRQAGDFLGVHLTFRASDNSMKTIKQVDPSDLFDRRSIKGKSRLHTVVASLHAGLAPFGCSAWALPTESLSLATIVMTVPLWHGPTEHE